MRDRSDVYHEIDVFASKREDFGTIRVAVECKYVATPISIKEVRNFHDKLDTLKINKGIFVSTGGFTADAEAYAKTQGIELWDRATVRAKLEEQEQEVSTPREPMAGAEHPLIMTAKRLGLSTEGKTQKQISDEIMRTVRPAEGVGEREPYIATQESSVRSGLSSLVARWVHWLVHQGEGEEYGEDEQRQFRTMTLIVLATALAVLLANSVLKALWGGILLWGGLLSLLALLAYYKRGEMRLPVVKK
jgi:hypothetical protein